MLKQLESSIKSLGGSCKKNKGNVSCKILPKLNETICTSVNVMGEELSIGPFKTSVNFRIKSEKDALKKEEFILDNRGREAYTLTYPRKYGYGIQQFSSRPYQYAHGMCMPVGVPFNINFTLDETKSYPRINARVTAGKNKYGILL